MPFYPNELVRQVRLRREQGDSIKGLARKFGISYSTASKWVYDIHSDNIQFKKARAKDQQRKERYKHLVESFTLDSDRAKVLASLLYWCEGNKYPTTQFIQFANSDHRLMKSFIELLRRAFPIDEKRIRAHLQIHDTQDYAQLLRFWSKLLGIPPSQFYRPTVTTPGQNMKRRDYMGTCTIKYFDVTLLLSITGIYEAFAEK